MLSESRADGPVGWFGAQAEPAGRRRYPLLHSLWVAGKQAGFMGDRKLSRKAKDRKSYFLSLVCSYYTQTHTHSLFSSLTALFNIPKTS